MAAILQLPNGTFGICSYGKWYSPDPKAAPMLEYFSRYVTGDVYTNPDSAHAREVAKMIVGARFIYSDPSEPIPTLEEIPDLLYDDETRRRWELSQRIKAGNSSK